MLKLDNLSISSTCKYHVISKAHCIDSHKYKTYGIGTSLPCKVEIHDISTYKDTVMNMVKLFNRHQLSPIHIKDVVENMLP